MSSESYEQRHLERLRQWRNHPERDLTLSFLPTQFKRQVERPFKQLQGLTTLWAELVPADLAGHCRLEGLSHGVLKVSVDSSPHLYELDRLLRQGLQRTLVARHRGPLRRVQLRLADHSQTPRPDAQR